LDAEEIEQGEWFTPQQVADWMKDRPQDFASALLVIWPKAIAFQQ
jgi:hypothetical protein